MVFILISFAVECPDLLSHNRQVTGDLKLGKRFFYDSQATTRNYSHSLSNVNFLHKQRFAEKLPASTQFTTFSGVISMIINLGDYQHGENEQSSL